MKLQALTLQGFKSFPDRTVIDFSGGITAIVGPNGSGKSNISDAIRWVLGEQGAKSLRGQKMEDVIFGGAKGRKGTGFAFVSLTIENKDRELDVDEDVVTISRKLYRDGESEYRINENSVRLRDVREILMDTGLGKDGYCIIGQGKIADIVSAKSEERREIFEEASGISKFRFKKSEAERKLLQTEENLTRLNDIMSELEGRVEPLRRQSEKAKEFLALSERKKDIEITLWSEKSDELRNKLNELEERTILSRNSYGEIDAILSDIEKQIDQLYRSSGELNILAEEIRANSSQIERDISEKRSSLAVLKSEFERNQRDEEDLNVLISEKSSGKEELEASLREKSCEAKEKLELISSLEKEKLALQEEIVGALSKRDEINKNREAVLDEKSAYDERLSKLIIKKASSDAVILEARERLLEIEKSREIIESNILSYQNDVDESKKLEENLCQEIESLENMLAGYEMKLGSLRKSFQNSEELSLELEHKLREISQRKAILLDMEKNMEGFASSVKLVMKQKQRGILKGIHTTVASLISAKEKYSVAIEIALGGSAQNIVTDDEASARNAISMLKSSSGGRATFLPLTSIKSNGSLGYKLDNEEGFIGLASELCSYEERYSEIIKNLLGKTAVVSDIDCAIAISKKFKSSFRIVTLDGQLMNRGGSMTGGSYAKRSGLLSRSSQINSLESEEQKLGEKLEVVQKEKEENRLVLSQMESKLEMQKNLILERKQELVRAKSETTVLEGSLRDAISRKESGERELSGADEKIISLKNQIDGDKKLVDELSKTISSLDEEIASLKENADQLSLRVNSQREDGSKLDMKLLTAKKDLEGINLAIGSIEERMNEDEGQLKRHLDKINELKESSNIIELKEKELNEGILALQENARENEERAKEISSQRIGLEGETRKLILRQKDKQAEKEEFARELARLEEKMTSAQNAYDNIVGKLWDEYKLSRSDAREKALPIGDNKQEFEKELAGLKSKIRQMGAVNVSAIEEYKEISERYSFMKAQLKDVVSSKNELTQIIMELTGNMKAMFSESFQQIAENFTSIFRELFGGGNAELSLDDPENVLESGISIKVEPPGKIIKNLSSLSGGEQAFIAVAIYFAILKVRPTPFCVLDEIEAALDEVNVVKYARYLKNFITTTQFITITHRRGTMENADVLYGVTMQEEGISKLLKLDVNKYNLDN